MDEVQGSRSVILAAALALFSERGYEGVGVSEICAAAGITKPSLYHYFGSKRGLLDAIIEERGAPLLRTLGEAARYGHDVPRGLEGIAFAFTRFAREEPAFARMRLALSFAPPASEGGLAAAELNGSLYEAVRSFFRAAEEDHGNMRGRSAAYAASFIGTVDSYVGYYLAGRMGLGEEVIRAAVRQFMYGIFS
jgi:AcrR family transcriptional regulator